MKSHPKLWPYGRGGFVEGAQGMSFGDRARYFLELDDKRFREDRSILFEMLAIMQKKQVCYGVTARMSWSDYNKLSGAMLSITADQIRQAEREEASGQAISDPKVVQLRKAISSSQTHVMGSDKSRTDMRTQLWGTTVAFGPPFIWLTINPNDVHDPIVQVLIGEEVDLDMFDPSQTRLDARKRMQNIANDPYGVAQYFHLVMDALLSELVGVHVFSGGVQSEMGIFGLVKAYFGAVEEQNRGALHAHLLLWLEGCPGASELYVKFKEPAFRERVRSFIKQAVSAHVEGLNPASADQPKRGPNPSFSRPPDPDRADYEELAHAHLGKIVLNSQIHICSTNTCLQHDRYGHLKCKRRAPFELSEDDTVDENGSYAPRRTIPMLNNFNKSVSICLQCNNDVKLITSGPATNDLAHYLFGYTFKKQYNKNGSGLMAKAKLFPELLGDQSNTMTAKALLNRCVNICNREKETSGPLAVCYLMGWGDTFKSHRYTPMRFYELRKAILRVCPELETQSWTRKLVIITIHIDIRGTRTHLRNVRTEFPSRKNPRYVPRASNEYDTSTRFSTG